MVKTIYVKKILTDLEIKALMGTMVPKDYFKTIINEDCDVICEEDNKYLLRFRKNVLSIPKSKEAFDNLFKFSKRTTTLRGYCSGTKGTKNSRNNKPIMSNILGYFDTLSVYYKGVLKENGLPMKKCRETSFTGNQKKEWNLVIPLIEEIDNQYKLLFPEEHNKQLVACQSTKLKITNTAFSTITINLNNQTAIHTDKGDFKEGFGNLVVIEQGTYEGGYTGFPQYGVAVDIRTGDFLAMNVHKEHCNTPIEGTGYRMSLVSYLREGIVKNCQDTDIFTMEEFNKIKNKSLD